VEHNFLSFQPDGNVSPAVPNVVGVSRQWRVTSPSLPHSYLQVSHLLPHAALQRRREFSPILCIPFELGRLPLLPWLHVPCLPSGRPRQGSVPIV